MLYTKKMFYLKGPKSRNIFSVFLVLTHLVTTIYCSDVLLPTNCSSTNNTSGIINGNCTILTTNGSQPNLTIGLEQDEHKGRALNFTMDENSTDNIIQSTNRTGKTKFRDLSDVSLDDDDEDDNMEHDIQNAKIITSKVSPNGSNVKGICEKGGLTYDNGEKLENGCESICTCMNGKMDCTARCISPYMIKGKKLDDPLCIAKDAEDPCCSLVVCAADTETEPLEICSWNNKTYHRGESFNKDCDEVCNCEIAGKISCKPRCPPVNKTSPSCVELQDPNDTCCKQIFCDVNLDDHVEKFEDKHKLISAKYINSSTVELNFEPKLDMNDQNNFIEASQDKKDWKTYEIQAGKYVQVYPGSKYIKIENSDDIIAIQEEQVKTEDVAIKDGCSYKGKTFKLDEEYNDNCTSLCVCKSTGMHCLKLECPTYFGVDVLDPNCIEWETVPPNFVPSPPNCCAEEIKCKNNGSCTHEGQIYQNWQELPSNVTGCEKKCYCEMGKIECQNHCPPVTALPPPDLPCSPSEANIGHLPDDDCCMYWICQKEPTEVKPEMRNNNTATRTDSPIGIFGTTTVKTPSKVLGPLVIYANKDNNTTTTDTNPLYPNENPYYNKNSNPNKILNKNQDKKDKMKPKQPSKDTMMFVTPPPSSNIDHSYKKPPPEVIHNNVPNSNSHSSKPPQNLKPQYVNNNTPDELLQFIHQHPEIANYPSGSVFEIHNIPSKNRPPPHQVVPYVVPHPGGTSQMDDLPPGITLEQIIHEIQKNAVPPTHRPPHIIPYPGPVIIAPQSVPNTTYHHPGGQIYGGYDQQEEITVHSLQAIDAHTVRLAFLVPQVIVGLHGRVEVRYTYHDDNDFNNWDLQVFAPPNDLIATSQLEFDLLNLKSDTEYKIKITITLRDIHSTPSSRVYKIRTLREVNTTPLPPMIPIEPELAITDINATWVTVIWRKFTEYELQFIDGVQLRYKEIDGKIYSATPLIHRSVTSYTLENLKPNTKYEIGIFFIPFPGQLTELHSEHMLHFTTANEIDTYGFNVTLDITHIKSTSVEIMWSGVPYPEDKYVNIYRAIYQSDTGKEDQSTFKIAKRDSPTKTIIMDLKPGTRYRLWLEVYLTNGKIKTSNVQDFITKPRAAIALGAASQQGQEKENKGDYYGPLVIVAILASIAILSTLILLLILIRRHNQNKAAITPPSRVSQSAYDNPTYKVEIQQETMGL